MGDREDAGMVWTWWIRDVWSKAKPRKSVVKYTEEDATRVYGDKLVGRVEGTGEMPKKGDPHAGPGYISRMP